MVYGPASIDNKPLTRCQSQARTTISLRAKFNRLKARASRNCSSALESQGRARWHCWTPYVREMVTSPATIIDSGVTQQLFVILYWRTTCHHLQYIQLIGTRAWFFWTRLSMHMAKLDWILWEERNRMKTNTTLEDKSKSVARDVCVCVCYKYGIAAILSVTI